MNYGAPYLGSKSKIAREIVSLFPIADNFYDLFAGGCAITHALMIKKHDLFHGGYKKYIINDINNAPKLFCDAISGKYRNEKRWISREMFRNELKKDKPDPYIRWVWSFGNNGRSYLFPKDIEPIKKAFHYVVIFDNWSYFEKLYTYGFLKEVLKKYRIDKPEVFLNLYKETYREGGGRREHLRVVNWIRTNYLKRRYSFLQLQQLQPEQLAGLQRLEQLEQLERLERLQQLEQLARLERLQQDYRDVKISPNSVVYCDIPYKIKEAVNYLKEEFNHKAFWGWAEKQNHAVYVSEYNYNGRHPEKWKVVYEKEKVSLRGGYAGKREEET